MTELLVGTRKGLFVLRGDPGKPFSVAHRVFAGDVAEFAARDPRTGRSFASVTSGFYGPRVFWTDDLTAEEWKQSEGPAFPEGSMRKKRIGLLFGMEDTFPWALINAINAW